MQTRFADRFAEICRIHTMDNFVEDNILTVFDVFSYTFNISNEGSP